MNGDFMILMAQDVKSIMKQLGSKSEDGLNFLYWGRIFNGNFAGYYIECYMTSFHMTVTEWRKANHVPEIRLPRDNPHDTFNHADFISLIPLSYLMEWEPEEKIQSLYMQIHKQLSKTKFDMITGCYKEVGNKWLSLASLEL